LEGNAAYRKALTRKSKAEVRNIGECLLKLDKIRNKESKVVLIGG
jgi:hypothetical protein